MNKPALPYRWYAPWRAVAAPQDDPADLGTAFGLDLSMSPPPGAGIPPATGSAPRGGGWVRRWVGRRRTTT